MFGSLFRQAQETVDNAIGQIVNRIIIAVPFIVALGFATAALSSWLSRSYGSEVANLMLAGGYAAIGLIAALVLTSRSARPQPAATEETVANANAEAAADTAGAAPKFSLNEADRDLLMTALTTAVPIALPSVMRGVLRNLPMVLLLAVAGYIVSRVIARSGDTDGNFRETGAVPDAAE